MKLLRIFQCVNISIKATGEAVVSDYDGNFKIQVPKNAILEIQYKVLRH